MNIPTGLSRDRALNSRRDILARWVWTIPILLIVAALALRQIDLFAPTCDEFFSMFNAGWLVNAPYSPTEILDSIRKNSPNHAPGYFMLLSAWGNLMTFDAAVGRVLSIFFALLALGISYRVLSDFVSPVAGLFATVILASNAFFNFFIPHMRMYPMLLFLAGAVLWLYLRILYQVNRPKRTDYAALFLTVYALANTQVFSAIFFITLGAYHLIFVPKNRIWWRVSSAIIAALILFLPYVLAVVPAGMEQTVTDWGHQTANGAQAVAIWLTIFTNGQPLLMLFSLIGVALGHRKRLIALKPYFYLVIVYALTLGLFAQFTPFVATSNMRHQLASWLLFALVAALGLLSMYRFRRWLAILLLLWLVAGAAFQTTADWRYYLAGRIQAFDEPPWHVVSRALARRDTQSLVIGLRLPLDRISSPKHIGYSQLEHFFVRANIDFRTIDTISDAEELIQSDATAIPEFWILYQKGYQEKRDAKRLQELAIAALYTPCETIETGIDTVLKRYRWLTLGCEPQPEPTLKHNAFIDYKFHAALLNSTDSRLYFADEWQARNEDKVDNFNISLQLISPDWENVAQLDLPLEGEGQFRQFVIDVGNAPRGSYRLMAIVYDSLTGKRLPWADSGADSPDFLPLADIALR